MTWIESLIDECSEDIRRGLNHSLNNAPGRVRLAEIALERLVILIRRLNHRQPSGKADELLFNLRKQIQEAATDTFELADGTTVESNNMVFTDLLSKELSAVDVFLENRGIRL